MMDPKNDPISKKNNIVLSAPVYKQSEDVVQLSPSRQLVADAFGIDEYTYDGCGKTIHLASGKEEKESQFFLHRPIIIIGRGKHIRFINVKFEVVSPEFTFYDSSKSFLDDSSHGEKLLRAKMDVSFMFASKEDDKWIRGLVKDLIVEVGSGLLVLDPMDMSGGYTSMKDKMSISIVSTDIYAHLSLGVISLLLNLQSQASAALQFGNTDPLAPCTNFDRIWVSPKENGRLSNLTFWRPRAPSNYAVLGDCLTSRPANFLLVLTLKNHRAD